MKSSVICAILVLGMGITSASSRDSRDENVQTRVERVDIVDYGIYTTEVSRVVDAPESITGNATSVSRRETELVSETDRIPATLGTLFGFRYRVVGEPRNRMLPLRLTVRMPETGVDDRETYAGRTISHTLTPPIGKKYFVGFGFQTAQEQIPGTWIFQLSYKDGVMAEKRFTVFLPEAPP